jgi:hypothetical protein
MRAFAANEGSVSSWRREPSKGPAAVPDAKATAYTDCCANLDGEKESFEGY